MGQIATEGAFNPDVSIRTLLDSVRNTLETRYTSVDSAEELLAKMTGEVGELNQVILDISNIMARVHNGEVSKTDAIEEATPLVKILKEHCTALHLDSSLSPTNDICETEILMLKEFTTQCISLVTQHIEKLKGNEGSDGEGKAATITDGAATENLFAAMLNGNTTACENLLRSDNMNSVENMMYDVGNESVGGSLGRAIDAVGGAIKSAAHKVWAFLKKIVGWIANKIKQLGTAIKNLAMGAWTKFKAAVKAFTGFVKSKTMALWGWIMKTVQAAKNKGGEALAAAKAKVKELTASIHSKLQDRAAMKALKKAAKQQAKNGAIPADILKDIQDMADNGADIAGKIEQLEASDEVKDVIASALSTLKSIGVAAQDLAEVSDGGDGAGDATPSADSTMEMYAMAREAAKNGDLEGAVESLISAFSGAATESAAGGEDPSDEDIATENMLLELELL